jgi:hypothetical protein
LDDGIGKEIRMSISARKAWFVASVVLGLATLGGTAMAGSDDNTRTTAVNRAATKAKGPPLSAAAAELAAAQAAEQLADANLSAALEADEQADIAHDIAVATAKANPVPANLAAVRAAYAADEEADERLTAALLADKEADENLKAAQEAYAAEIGGASPSAGKPGVVVTPAVARE